MEKRNDMEIKSEQRIKSENKEMTNSDSHNYEHYSHSSHHGHHHSSHHSHHGHHSHGHHHRRRSSHKKSTDRKKQNRKEKFERFIRHNKKYIIYCVVAIAVFICMIFVGVYLDGINRVEHQGENSGEQYQGEQTEFSHLQVKVPFFAEDVVIVSPAVEVFVKSDDSLSVNDVYKMYSSASARLDVGMPVKLSYDISEVPAGYNVKKAEILVADNKNFTAPRVYNLEGYETKVDVYNLKTGTKYYYTINLIFANGFETSVSGSFTTAEGPRVMNVDGVYNMRDIGGWKTTSGKKIKQELLYRGCEIDGAIEPKYTITDSGINTMLKDLGIKTEMDLRTETDNIYGTHMLGAAVKHNYYETAMYSSIFNDKTSNENIRRVFSDLADKKNYPVYLHCTYGQDRTGTVCYLLEALLGVSEENMMKDYLLSGLHHGDVYGGKEPMDEFIADLQKFPGVSMSEKVEYYLLSIGVTAKEISSIRNIFLAD